jgi:hypothetical protein
MKYRVLAPTVLAIAALPQSGSDAQPVQTSPALAIQPMTQIGEDGSGYLADPQPIRTMPSSGNRVQMLSGTTKAIVRCAYPIKPGCFSWTPITVTAGTLKAQIEAAGAHQTNIQNTDIFQDDHGGWHAAVTIGVASERHPKHWTIVAHAHPVGPQNADTPPTTWEADTVLSGSFSRPVEGNYDGKYFEDGGRLYLLYVDTIAPPPALRNAIFLQPMESFTRPAATPRIMLLHPGDREGDLQSESYANTQAKLVEAPYISRVGDKYALVYSSGAYLTPGYKAAVAWSDTLIPAGGRLYRKVMQIDQNGIWGHPGGREVHYLVQSERPRWPNFTKSQVIGPGVAAAIQGPAGAWWLYFNGFAPDDMSVKTDGRVDGSHRRPYALRLRVQVPAGRSVASASDAELASWMEPETR